MNIATSELKEKIEPHFWDDLSDKLYNIHNVDAKKLLTPNRLDLGFKLYYLLNIKKNPVLARNVYLEHIKAFSLGSFKEPGNTNKNSIEDFINEFHSIFDSIDNCGFDRGKTIIPLSCDSSILNGSHRISSAVFLNKQVECIKLDIGPENYDYLFFHDRGVDRYFIERAVEGFLNFADNIYIAFIWPSSRLDDEFISRHIPSVLYYKKIQLNQNGAHNILTQIYAGEKWLGSSDDGFAGVKGKLVECFNNSHPLKVVLFQCDSLENVLIIKDKIRKILNIGKHSIHISDTRSETLALSNIILNDNSIHFLNYAKPTKVKSCFCQIENFKLFIRKHNINIEDVVLDSGMTISAYGIRESLDVDYLSVLYNYKNEDGSISQHGNELIHHGELIEDLVYNPRFYFYFNGLKFVSFEQVYKMKKHRSEPKDCNDISMMQAFIENNFLKEFVYKIKQKVLYMKTRFKRWICDILKSLGLFDIIRSVIKGK